MKLHYNPFSPNCRKVALVATYINAKVDFVTLNVPAGALEKPDYLAMNPNGLMPTLQDGDFYLWESNAIMQYVAEKSGATEVWPADLKRRSLVNQWQFWETNHFGRAVQMLQFEKFMKKVLLGEEADAATVTTYMEYFKTHGQVLNAHLAKSKFVVGDNPTLADFAIAGAMQWSARADLPLNDFPHIVQWFGRMKSLEAWKKTEPQFG